ncbi:MULTISPECIES: hypothetical protein [unclassified Okeania]|nr:MULTISPECIES: hypothetical protein [unclassified Okeania]
MLRNVEWASCPFLIFFWQAGRAIGEFGISKNLGDRSYYLT